MKQYPNVNIVGINKKYTYAKHIIFYVPKKEISTLILTASSENGGL